LERIGDLGRPGGDALPVAVVAVRRSHHAHDGAFAEPELCPVEAAGEQAVLAGTGPCDDVVELDG